MTHLQASARLSCELSEASLASSSAGVHMCVCLLLLLEPLILGGSERQVFATITTLLKQYV
jgi:hypothetical protein